MRKFRFICIFIWVMGPLIDKVFLFISLCLERVGEAFFNIGLSNERSPQDPHKAQENLFLRADMKIPKDPHTWRNESLMDKYCDLWVQIRVTSKAFMQNWLPFSSQPCRSHKGLALTLLIPRMGSRCTLGSIFLRPWNVCALPPLYLHRKGDTKIKLESMFYPVLQEWHTSLRPAVHEIRSDCE